MSFLNVFSSRPTPKQVAKDRLKVILIHDRGELSDEVLDKIRLEIYFLEIVCAVVSNCAFILHKIIIFI